MLDKLFYFIMVPMVYIAFVLFFFGLIYALIRVARAPKQTSTLRIFPKTKNKLAAIYDTFAMPTIRRDKPVFWIFLILYHLAFLLLILGHLDLIPGIQIMPADSKHMLGFGAVGVVVTISAVYFLLRRFRTPVREISVSGDYLILLLLILIFITGGIMSWSNSWGENGFVLEKSDFANYMKILVSFSFEDPYPVLESSHYFHVVFHVLLANIFLMVFPFTKFIHTFFAMLVNRIRRG
jgi:nitrate reductase gamma subunit